MKYLSKRWILLILCGVDLIHGTNNLTGFRQVDIVNQGRFFQLYIPGHCGELPQKNQPATKYLNDFIIQACALQDPDAYQVYGTDSDSLEIRTRSETHNSNRIKGYYFESSVNSDDNDKRFVEWNLGPYIVKYRVLQSNLKALTDLIDSIDPNLGCKESLTQDDVQKIASNAKLREHSIHNPTVYYKGTICFRSFHSSCDLQRTKSNMYLCYVGVNGINDAIFQISAPDRATMRSYRQEKNCVIKNCMSYGFYERSGLCSTRSVKVCNPETIFVPDQSILYVHFILNCVKKNLFIQVSPQLGWDLLTQINFVGEKLARIMSVVNQYNWQQLVQVEFGQYSTSGYIGPSPSLAKLKEQENCFMDFLRRQGHKTFNNNIEQFYESYESYDDDTKQSHIIIHNHATTQNASLVIITDLMMRNSTKYNPKKPIIKKISNMSEVIEKLQTQLQKSDHSWNEVKRILGELFGTPFKVVQISNEGEVDIVVTASHGSEPALYLKLERLGNTLNFKAHFKAPISPLEDLNDFVDNATQSFFEELTKHQGALIKLMELRSKYKRQYTDKTKEYPEQLSINREAKLDLAQKLSNLFPGQFEFECYRLCMFEDIKTPI